MRILKFALPFLLCATMVAQQPTPVPKSPLHTGMWWRHKSDLYREAFIAGYKAGARQTAGHPTDVNKFPASILISGVDKFYNDFRNRSIVVDDALNYVSQQMRGVPDEQLKTELDHMRAAAALPASDD